MYRIYNMSILICFLIFKGLKSTVKKIKINGHNLKPHRSSSSTLYELWIIYWVWSMWRWASQVLNLGHGNRHALFDSYIHASDTMVTISIYHQYLFWTTTKKTLQVLGRFVILFFSIYTLIDIQSSPTGLRHLISHFPYKQTQLMSLHFTIPPRDCLYIRLVVIT